MANPSTAHEPSMEEILASIRQIISEDGEATARGETFEREPERNEFQSGASGPPGASEPAIEDESLRQGAFMKQPQRTNIHPIVSDSSSEPERPSAYASIGSAPRAAISSQQPYSDDEHLLSDQSDSAVSGAFSALAHTILAQNARTLEDLVAEMLQPMLKEWLDDNLPSLVERLVQEEIHRVSRGRR